MIAPSLIIPYSLLSVKPNRLIAFTRGHNSYEIIIRFEDSNLNLKLTRQNSHIG